MTTSDPSFEKLVFPIQRKGWNTGGPATYPIEEAAWVWHPDLGKDEEAVLEFTKSFTVSDDQPVVVHLSADQRFELFLDDTRISRGPEAGDLRNYFFHSYRFSLKPGEHKLRVVCWWLGDGAPVARVTHRGGFILKADGAYHEVLTTGAAEWQVSMRQGLTFDRPDHKEHFTPPFAGSRLNADLSAAKSPAVPAITIARGHIQSVWGPLQETWQLSPSQLPDMMEQPRTGLGKVRAVIEGGLERGGIVTADHAASALISRWQEVLANHNPVTIPPRSKVSVLVDLDDYYCAYPRIIIDGGQGGSVTCEWMEALHTPGGNHEMKGHRDEVIDQAAYGFGDTWQPAGEDSAELTSLWWRAGRYVLLTITTEVEPLVFHKLEILETRYPLEAESTMESPDHDFSQITRICTRALQMCAHETYMDCPYYEQLMYLGDTRLQVLTHYQLQHDSRLPRKALSLFNESRFPGGGFTTSRYPGRGNQIIPTFSLIWVWMLNDFLYWRDNREFVESQLRGMRNLIQHFIQFTNEDGLLHDVPPWLFMDWVRAWRVGVAPGSNGATSGLINLMWLNTLHRAEEIEEACGSNHFGEELREISSKVAAAIYEKFWVSGRKLFADDTDHSSYSEHAQCLAQMAGLLDQEEASANVKALTSAKDLHRTTVYFRHYLYETFNLWNLPELIFEDFQEWEAMAARGARTTFEKPEPTRSDCHAWAAHPLFHLSASFMGIRPSVPFYAAVEVVPKLGPLKRLSAKVPHPKGWIHASVDLTGKYDRFEITLPETIHGELVWNKGVIRLEPGKNLLEL